MAGFTELVVWLITWCQWLAVVSYPVCLINDLGVGVHFTVAGFSFQFYHCRSSDAAGPGLFLVDHEKIGSPTAKNEVSSTSVCHFCDCSYSATARSQALEMARTTGSTLAEGLGKFLSLRLQTELSA